MAPRGIRHVIAAGLGTLVLLSCTTTGGDSPASHDDEHPNASGTSNGFTTRYEEPSPTDRAPASLLRGRKTAEAAATSLNALVALDQQITVVSRYCDGEGSAYDPQNHRIELCYDDTAEDRVLFQDAGRRPGDDEATAVATETLYHEAGHALIDLLGLSLTDHQEEDAADQFAAFMLLRTGPDGERQLRTAAEAYELSTTADDNTDSRDEHSANRVRAANHLCYLYGSAPARHKDLATTGRIPSTRVTRCIQEWDQAHTTWMTRLHPILRA